MVIKLLNLSPNPLNYTRNVKNYEQLAKKFHAFN